MLLPEPRNVPLSPSHGKEQSSSEVTMSQGEQKSHWPHRRLWWEKNAVERPGTAPSPSLLAPGPGRILIVLVHKRACSLPGDQLVTEEGQEGGLLGD